MKTKEFVAGGRYLKRPYRRHEIVEEKIKDNEGRKRNLTLAQHRGKEAIPACYVCGGVGTESIEVRGSRIRLCTKHLEQFLQQLSMFLNKEFTNEGILPSVIEGITGGTPSGDSGEK